MKRREFITLLGGAAAVWPVMAGAQQREADAADWHAPESARDQYRVSACIRAFVQGLKQLGWTFGRNLSSTRAGPG